MARRWIVPLALLVTLLGGGGRAAAQDCLGADPPALSAPAQALRFGIFPLAAGSAGAAQAEPAPEDPAKALAALHALRPPGKELVIRLNRMFWSDGDAGLARFAALVDGYARAGFRSELQVRYHPPEGHAGDIAGWLDYVRAAVRTFAPRRSVVALSIGAAALAAIAIVDVIFAVDSVPAILAITPEAFIVFAANAFALLGLRPLFFLVAELVDRLYYLKAALAVLLIAIGLKMAAGELFGKIGPEYSLPGIALILGTGVLASLVRERRARTVAA